jgi:hypothetical protein
VRIEMDEGVFLVEIEMLGQPIKGAGVAVLYIDRQRDRPGVAPPGDGDENQNRPEQFHRAGWIFGFSESLARSSRR